MRLLRIIVNWSAFLTAPVWCGFFLIGHLIWLAIKDKNRAREMFKGEEWFWE